MFKKILIANRGEIAVRVIRACRDMGIVPVAVYSDADRAALHVRMADEAYHIGPAPASGSYLNIHNILEAARKSGAQAVHPGYGFLSENADFADACVSARVKFIGPSAASMRLMGSKTAARQHIQKIGLPCVPGSLEPLDSLEQAAETAQRIGYPVMLKAAAGGGGMGMRLVHTPDEMRSSLEAAQSEAQRAFGDSAVYLEKAILNPRHIEVQILADEHGNTVHLGERECSIQRRHQKVLEESPSSVVDASLRNRMGETAVQIAKAAKYANAGTIEFLLDDKKNFYFLEINTRLQVEHPVTELVTGFDLVTLQIKIAANEKLPFLQKDVNFRGHAIECRIYAEDPSNHYFPSPGKITLLKEPAGPGIRLDSGAYEGWNVPTEYDPLLAKLIGYGENRTQAISRLLRALDETFIGGIETNLRLFRRILQDPKFCAGEIDTGFLDRLPHENNAAEAGHHEVAAIAAGLFTALDHAASAPRTEGTSRSESKWKRAARIESFDDV